MLLWSLISERCCAVFLVVTRFLAAEASKGILPAGCRWELSKALWLVASGTGSARAAIASFRREAWISKLSGSLWPWFFFFSFYFPQPFGFFLRSSNLFLVLIVDGQGIIDVEINGIPAVPVSNFDMFVSFRQSDNLLREPCGLRGACSLPLSPGTCLEATNWSDADACFPWTAIDSHPTFLRIRFFSLSLEGADFLAEFVEFLLVPLHCILLGSKEPVRPCRSVVSLLLLIVAIGSLILWLGRAVRDHWSAPLPSRSPSVFLCPLPFGLLFVLAAAENLLEFPEHRIHVA